MSIYVQSLRCLRITIWNPPESYINIIGTRLRDDELPLAIRMITGLCTARLIPPKNLFYSTLKLCKKVGDWETSVKILILMESYIRRGVSEEAYEACIDTCLSCNQHKAASAIISRMHIAGCLNVNLFKKNQSSIWFLKNYHSIRIIHLYL